MALNFTVSYTFSPNTTIASAQVNTNTSDVSNVFTGLEAKTKSFSALKVDATPTTSTEVAIKSYVDSLLTWRRPVLQYASSTTVSIESGINGTSGQVYMLFPDGTTRTDSTATHITLDVSRVAALSGSKQSGLRTSTVATNTWYAVYAVKATDNSTDFVAVADTVLPLQTNYATLNTNFGTSGWVYLGMIRNGDNSGSTGVILTFRQYGNYTLFWNECTATSTFNGSGIRLATGAPNATWTQTSGTGTTATPDHCLIGDLAVSANGTTNTTSIKFTAQSSATLIYAQSVVGGATTNQMVARVRAYLGLGAATTMNVGGSTDIFLIGWIDGALGVGANPLL